MLSSCQDVLTQIHYKSMYSVACPKNCLGVYKIAFCDTVQCNEGAQGALEKYLLRRLK